MKIQLIASIVFVLLVIGVVCFFSQQSNTPARSHGQNDDVFRNLKVQ